LLYCAASCVCDLEVFEQKGASEKGSLTRHWLSATFTRNAEHMGGSIDIS